MRICCLIASAIGTESMDGVPRNMQNADEQILMGMY
jgi:hypothetical protein